MENKACVPTTNQNIIVEPGISDTVSVGSPTSSPWIWTLAAQGLSESKAIPWSVMSKGCCVLGEFAIIPYVPYDIPMRFPYW